MRLPAALAEWEPLLELLPEDVRSAVVGLAERLAPAIGPFPPTEAAPGQDIDGFAGLARRGPYERLLLSEWALATTVPLEFLRRAAEKEHLFYDLSRRGSAPRRRSLAIFDGGPAQLGGPRVVHLALALLLGARARRAGADFWWAVGQADGSGWVREIDELTVPALFHGRSTRPLACADIDRLLAVEGAATDDLWIIGAGGLAHDGAHHVNVEDLLEDTPGTRRLAVRVLPRGRMERRVELALPSPALAARIVSAPFRRPHLPAPRRVPPGRLTTLGFAATAARVFGCGAHAYFTASVPSPGAGNLAQISSHQRAEGARILGLQIASASLWALVHLPGRDEVVLQQYPRWSPRFTAEVRFGLRGQTLPATEHPGQLFVRRVQYRHEWVLHIADELWILSGIAARMAKGVYAVAPGKKDPEQLTVIVDAAEVSALRSTLANRSVQLVHDGGTGQLLEAWLGRTEHRRGARFLRTAGGVSAASAWVDSGRSLEEDGADWIFRSSGQPVDLPVGALPLGVFTSYARTRIVAISADRRRLEGHAAYPPREGPLRFHESQIPLVAGAVSLCRPEAVVLDEQGELTFLGLGHRPRVLARARHPEEQG